ncbi:uncharacterized protein LOC124110684 [Haliotis rufescens]|uniref:uncharacterized protein LOC124110684 n=1 Tax=Haliotis rufescens TaxID=6454 RepID=UPI00201EDC82|nr:uncharacterized protein LOC124110684 [Haliotis rufescens]
MEVAPQTHYEEIHFIDKKGPQKCRPWCSSSMCFVVLILSMFLNGGLGAFIVYKMTHKEHAAPFATGEVKRPDIADSVCVSCDSLNVPDLSRSPLENQVKVVMLGQGSFCCLENTEGLGMYMNIVVREYYHDLNGENRSGDLHMNHDRPAAHLYLHTNSVPDQHLQWDSSPGYGTAHVTGNVTYSNGRLHVPRDGVYYIYSFLTIRSDVVTNDDLNIVHSVQKYNSDHIDTDSHLLLMGKTTLKERHGQFTNSFLAANLKLKKNDELFVSLSNTSLVYTFPPANYFGVHML